MKVFSVGLVLSPDSLYPLKAVLPRTANMVVDSESEELMFTLASEGAGLDVYRARRECGLWEFFYEGTRGDFTPNSDQVADKWTSGKFGTITELLDSSWLGFEILNSYVLDVHPECRNELKAYAAKMLRSLPVDYIRKYPHLCVLTSDNWVAGLLRS